MQQMGDAYPELSAARAHRAEAWRQEESRFAETLAQGMALFDDAHRQAQGRHDPGRRAFRLYDTFGFPLDLTADIARERGLASTGGLRSRNGEHSAGGRVPRASSTSTCAPA